MKFILLFTIVLVAISVIIADPGSDSSSREQNVPARSFNSKDRTRKSFGSFGGGGWHPGYGGMGYGYGGGMPFGWGR